MWDWLDDISGDSLNFSGGDTNDFYTGTETAPGQDLTSPDYGYDPGGAGTYNVPTDSSTTIEPNLLDLAKQYAAKYGGSLDAARQVVQQLAARVGNLKSTRSTGGGILDNVLNDPLGAAFNSAPFLLALNEANRQSGDLNNTIGKINQDSYRKAVLDPFDLETGQGRAALQSDLGQRGVAGSSFGYQTLNNFDYNRNLARSDMAEKANLSAAGLEGNLINQRNTNRNLLLGAGLNASGGLFAPQKDPFNLDNLSAMLKLNEFKGVI